MRRQIREGERGWALIAVVAELLILSTLAAGLVSLSLTTVRLEHTSRAQLEAAAIAEAAFARAMVALLDPRPEARWRVDAVPQRFSFAGTDVTVRVQDELGKIDLNATDSDTLNRLLTNVGGLDLDTAQALTDKILDWREADDLKHLKGATREDYMLAGKAYAPRNGPFQSLDELKLVLGMTDALYARIAPALTVYSKRPTYDALVAPREVLLTIPGEDQAKVEKTLQDRTADVRRTAGPSVYVRPGVLDPAIPLGGRAFAITVTFDLKGRKRTGTATVMLTGDPRRPYLAYAWRIE